MSAIALFRPTFTDLRAEVERRVANGSSRAEIDELIRQFLAACGESPSPVVEYDGTVTWIYRDADAESVAVVGDFLGYDTGRTQMARLPGSDMFYLTGQMPLDAHVSYAYAVDNPCPQDSDRASWNAWLERCKIDPLNRRRILETHPLRQQSVLLMPSATQQPLVDVDSGVPTMLHVVTSAETGVSRRVWVHPPPNYSPRTRRYPTVYFADGEAYMLSARVANLSDELFEQGEIAPAVLVFVESPSHLEEDDAPAEPFVRFLANELVPWVDAHYAVSPDPRDRIVAGAATTGAVALYAVLDRPDVFGGALVQSPAPLLLTDEVTARVQENIARGFAPPRCYVDVGRYEAHLFLDHAHTLCNALLAAEAVLSYQEFPGDRSFVGWRSSLPDALRFHLGQPDLLDQLS
jgi:enterochelin esterase family protein